MIEDVPEVILGERERKLRFQKTIFCSTFFHVMLINKEFSFKYIGNKSVFLKCSA